MDPGECFEFFNPPDEARYSTTVHKWSKLFLELTDMMHGDGMPRCVAAVVWWWWWWWWWWWLVVAVSFLLSSLWEPISVTAYSCPSCAATNTQP